MKTSRLAFALVPLFVVASLPAQTSWTAGTGNFTDSSNWSAGVPSNNNTFITNGTSGAPSIVNLSNGSNQYVANLTLTADNTLNVNANSLLWISGNISNNGAINLGTGYFIVNSPNLTLTGSGTVTLSAPNSYFEGTSTGQTLTNQSTIVGQGTVGNGYLAVVNSGTINANVSGQTLTLDGVSGSVNTANTGLIEATNGGVLAISGGAVNNAGGNLTASGTGSTLLVTGNTTVKGGNLTASGTGSTLEISGAVVQGGTLTNSGGTMGTQPGYTATLDGSTAAGAVTLNGTYANGANTSTYVNGSIVNHGTIALTAGNSGLSSYLQLQGSTTLSGGGTLTLGSSDGSGTAYIQQSGGSATLTNADNTIQGYGTIGNGTLTLVNQGTINANSSGKTLLLNGGGGVTNTGTLEATGGGILNIQNMTVSDAGKSIQANGGAVQIQGSTIVGGALTATGGGTFNQGVNDTNVTLDGFTSGAFTISTGTTWNSGWNSTTYVNGSLINNGTIALTAGNAGYSSYLDLNGSTTLSGGGTVTLSSADGTGTVYIQQTGGSATLTNADNTIQGYGTIGNGTLTLVNQGTINANSSGKTLVLNGGGGVTNTGTLEATGGGILNILNTTVNDVGNSIQANGGAVQIQGSTIVGGALTATGGGTFNQGVNNTNVTFNPGSAPSTFTISTGTTWNNGWNSTTSVIGSLINNGTIALTSGNGGYNSYLDVLGNTTLSGGGTVTLSSSDNSGTVYIQQVGGNWTLTNADNTIQGYGIIGNGTLTLVNQGTINANSSGKTLLLNGGGGVTNTGTLEATGGGILLIQNTTVNDGGHSIQANGGAVQIEGSTIVGGALTATGGGTFNQGVNDTNVTLDGSTSGALTLSSGTTWNNGWNSATYVNGSIVNSGTIGITSGGGGYNSYLELQGNTTLSGGGTVTLGSSDGSGTAYILQTGSNLTLTNADNTIEGFGVIGNGTLAVINGGTLLANSAGNTLLVNGSGGLTNNGTLQANAGSTLQVTSNLTNFSAGTLTGGTYIVTGNALNAGTMQISSFGTGGGELVTNSATIALNGVNSDLTDSSGLNALNNGTTGLTTNTATGAFDITSGRVFNSVGNLSNAGNVEASGSGTNLIVGPTGTNTYTQTAGNTLLTIGGTLTAGTTHISGGTLTLNNGNIVSPVLTNDVGGTITGSGTITSATVSNQGLIQAAGPSLTLSNGVTGTGTLQTNTGSTLSLAGGTTSSTTGTLSLTGPLALGTNNITVSTIYTNANFGTGNSFNDHANVTGAGQILAAGNTALTITGAAVTNGGTATPTLTLGAIHVGGSETVDYAIQNSGSTGPSVTGAIQTGVNGGNITNGALSGTGVTAGNFAQLASGQSTTAYAITYDPTVAGALTGQKVHVASNFDNVTGPTITLTGGAAYNLASVNTLTTPVSLGNVHVGGTLDTALSISNTAPVNATYTETLAASVTGTTGGASTAGSISGLVAGAGPSTAISVGLNTATAGALSGTATVGFSSQAVNSSGLGTTALSSQTVTVTGNAYALASANSISTPINFGNFHVGATESTALGISNTAAVNPTYTETLAASVSGTTGSANSAGSISGLVAGAGPSTAISVGLNTGTAGALTGTATVGFSSQAVNGSGLGTTSLGSQILTINGAAYNLASASLGTINLGPVLVGSVVNPTLSVTNSGPVGSYTEGLDAAVAGFTGGVGSYLTSTNSLTNIAAGNSSNLTFSLNTSSAAVVAGTVLVNLDSNGTGTSGLGITALAQKSAPVDVTIEETVGNLANPSAATPNPVVLNARLGAASPTQALSITNLATGGPQEGLNASISTASTGVTAAGSFTSLAASGTNNSSLVVGINTGTAGAINGTATVALASDGTLNGSNNYATTTLTPQTITVQGGVYQEAAASITPSSNPVNLGSARIGGTLGQALTITNSAPNTGGYTENLGGSVTGTTGAASASGSFTGVAQGLNSTAISVGLATGTAGAVNGSATLGFETEAINGSGLGTASIGSQTVNLTGAVYQAAEANTLPTTINLGTVRTGTVVNSTTVPALGLSIQNVAPTTGGYTENLGASFGAVSSGLAGSGSPITGLAVGNTSNAMALTFTAGAAGTYNGSAVVNFQTQAINNSGLSNAGIGSQIVDVDAIVNALADGVVQQNGGTYSFSGAANSGTLNFGAITQGSGTVDDALELLNDVTGDADMLTGGYSPALVGPFSYTPGNGATFSLGDMQASDFDISFNTDYSPTGFFSETLVIDEDSYNAAQGAMDLKPYDLTIEGTINPAGVSGGVPDASATWLLLGLGLASLVLVGRRVS